MLMFALKGLLLSFFGGLLLLGSSDLKQLPSASYTSIDNISASENQEHVPLFFDAVLDFNHSSTFETPSVKTFSQTNKNEQRVSAPLFYPLSYYAIGQKIVIKLSTKAIIFPFHCFT